MTRPQLACPQGGAARVGTLTSAGAILLGALVVAASPALAGLPSSPVVQWSWDGRLRDAVRPVAFGTCLVVQFTDDDGNGRVDPGDDPDVLIHHFGSDGSLALDVVDGATGRLHLRLEDPRLRAESTSAGDIDGDGWTDLVVATPSSLVAFDERGVLLFERPLPERDDFGSAVGLMDMDSDGFIDFSVGRSVLFGGSDRAWLGAGGRGWYSGGVGPRSVALDVDPASAGLELVAGNTLYASDGSILWQVPMQPDGVPAIADFDRDGAPEVLLQTITDLVMLSASGAVLGRAADVSGLSEWPAAPVVADLDADGLPEIVTAKVDEVRAWEWTGTSFVSKWVQPTHAIASIPGPTAFDFDCDGAAEVVYRDEDNWYIFDGSDGSILHVEPFPSGTNREMCVVANVDDDPWAEIIVPAEWWEARIFEVPGSATPRPVHNQINYHVDNVLDDGKIPAREAACWLTHDTWLAQVPQDPARPCGQGCEPTRAGAVMASDPSPCLEGLLLEWDAAVFPSGLGRYHLYRSDDLSGLTCADALSRAPVATGLTSTSWQDTTTTEGRRYVYALQAEDSQRADPACRPVGPWGGTVDSSCSGVPLLAEGSASAPTEVGASLRVRHDGDVITLDWMRAPACRPDEHFHARRAEDPRGPWAVVSAEPWVAREMSYTDDRTRWLYCFLVRTANPCEDESVN